MPSKLKTALAFAKNIRTTGAITQTSKRTEEEITQRISNNSKIVVEFGMGHGNITEKILSKLPQDGTVYAFEVNAEFCEVVREQIADERLIIVNDTAENVKKHVHGNINTIISSMPLTMFSQEMRDQIFEASFSLLDPAGTFSQILYNKQSSALFDKYFDKIEINGVVALPPQYIYHCTDVSR